MSNRSYKASFIIDTHNSQQQIDTVCSRIQEVLKSLGASVKETQDLGQKEFSRVTRKNFTSGMYRIYHIEAPASLPKALKEKLRLDTAIDRIFIEAC